MKNTQIKELDKIKAKMKMKTKLNQSKDKNLPDKQFDQLLPDLQEIELQNLVIWVYDNRRQQ